MTTLSRPPADPSVRPGAREKFRKWLLFGLQDAKGSHQGPGAVGDDAHLKKHPWWQVMCLTGVDYFSTLGYQPAIAALAAGVISPLATLVLVAVTLLGALPVYRRVAGESHRGEGSIAMLERLLPPWGGKLLVLVLLGFAATDFMITMTLSAADATAHAIQNPFAPGWLQGQNVLVTLFLLALLAAVFLRGFKEAIGVAVALVAVYLALNVVVVGVTVFEAFSHPVAVGDWWLALTTSHGSPFMVIGIALLLFAGLTVVRIVFMAGFLKMVLQLLFCLAAALTHRTHLLRGRRRLGVLVRTMVPQILALILARTEIVPLDIYIGKPFGALPTTWHERSRVISASRMKVGRRNPPDLTDLGNEDFRCLRRRRSTGRRGSVSNVSHAGILTHGGDAGNGRALPIGGGPAMTGGTARSQRGHLTAGPGMNPGRSPETGMNRAGVTGPAVSPLRCQPHLLHHSSPPAAIQARAVPAGRAWSVLSISFGDHHDGLIQDHLEQRCATNRRLSARRRRLEQPKAHQAQLTPADLDFNAEKLNDRPRPFSAA